MKTGSMSGRLRLPSFLKGGDACMEIAFIVLGTVLLITILTSFICFYKLARKNRPNTKR